MIMGQLRGKSEGTQEAGCSAGLWPGPSLGCSEPWKGRKVGGQGREQGWTPDPRGRTRSFAAEEKLGGRRAER